MPVLIATRSTVYRLIYMYTQIIYIISCLISANLKKHTGSLNMIQKNNHAEYRI